MGTPIWPIEGVALDSTGDMVASSLADVALGVQTTVGVIETATGDIAGIKAVTDVLPNAGALTTISTAVAKIDSAAASGLSGTPGSLAYRIEKLEDKDFGWERWLGLAAAPSGEVHRADAIGTTTAPFQIDAGNVTWGTWLQILGSSDTPRTGGNTRYGLRRVLLTVFERKNVTHFIQIGFGTSGAAALSAGTYTELMIRPAPTQARVIPVDVNVIRQLVTTKAWARCWAIGADTGTIDFWIALREYVA